jgi:hypothetical protein
MESIEELKEHLTTWLDGRIDGAVKTAVDEGNTKLMEDLDTRFATLESGINNLGGTLSEVSKDVGGVSDSIAGLVQNVLAIPTSLAQVVTDTINRLNPFHLP